MSRLLIINGSPRENGLTAKISQMTAERVKKFGYETEIISLKDLKISDCKACMSCKTTEKCAIDDDMTQMYEKIRSSDMLILASPVYFGAETGTMRTFVDRFYAMVNSRDGERIVNFGDVKKGSVLLTCGAIDGYMTYGGVLSRITKTMMSMGVKDMSGSIICGIGPEDAESSEKVSDYIDSIEYQLEM